MLKLIAGPVSKLSNALNEAFGEIQGLYAVMHDPCDTLFNAGPYFDQLFEEGKHVEAYKYPIRVEHVPEDYDREDAEWVLAEALARIFGKPACADPTSSRTVLTAEICRLREARDEPDHAHHSLAIHVSRIIPEVPFDKGSHFWLGRLKETLYRTKKPDSASEKTDWYVLEPFLPTERIVSRTFLEDGVILAGPNASDSIVAVVEEASPFALRTHLISGIARIVYNHCNDNDDAWLTLRIADSTTPEPQGCTLSLSSTVSWFRNPKGPKELGQKLENEIKNPRQAESMAYDSGNFSKPFVQMIRRSIEKDGYDDSAKPRLEILDRGIRLMWPRLWLELDNNTLTLRSCSAGHLGENGNAI